MKLLQRRKFIRAIKEHFCSQPKLSVFDVDQLSISSSSTHTTFQMETELFSSEFDDPHLPSPTTVPIRRQRNITIHYIHCKNIFLLQSKQECIMNLDPSECSLSVIFDLIASKHDIPKELILEMYFSEGYPLDANKHTITGMLCNCILDVFLTSFLPSCFSKTGQMLQGKEGLHLPAKG